MKHNVFVSLMQDLDAALYENDYVELLECTPREVWIDLLECTDGTYDEVPQIEMERAIAKWQEKHT